MIDIMFCFAVLFVMVRTIYKCEKRLKLEQIERNENHTKEQ